MELDKHLVAEAEAAIAIGKGTLDDLMIVRWRDNRAFVNARMGAEYWKDVTIELKMADEA